MGKIVNNYSYKVNVPCNNCHALVKIGIDERISVCPVCHTEWNGNGKMK